MRVLITGTSGFVGAALARSMSASHEIVCLSRGATDVDGVTGLVPSGAEAVWPGDFVRVEVLVFAAFQVNRKFLPFARRVPHRPLKTFWQALRSS